MSSGKKSFSPLRGQVAVVTGATGGVGKAIAVELAAQGVKLCLVGRNAKALAIISDAMRSTAPVVQSCQADLSEEVGLKKLVELVRREFRQVNLLIHSAGIYSQGSMETSRIEDLDRLYRTNLRARYALTQRLLPLLKDRQGQIVFINSSLGLQAKGGVGQYSAVMHALKAVADSLRQEVNEHGVRILSVFLGRTATPMQAAVHKSEGRRYRPERLIQPEDIAATVVQTLNLPRTAEVTDLMIRPVLKPIAS
jgi:NADP-dependent 3-hydroxy acid dehydrogenase YdfG